MYDVQLAIPRGPTAPISGRGHIARIPAIPRPLPRIAKDAGYAEWVVWKTIHRRRAPPVPRAPTPVAVSVADAKLIALPTLHCRTRPCRVFPLRLARQAVRPLLHKAFVMRDPLVQPSDVRLSIRNVYAYDGIARALGETRAAPASLLMKAGSPLVLKLAAILRLIPGCLDENSELALSDNVVPQCKRPLYQDDMLWLLVGRRPSKNPSVQRIAEGDFCLLKFGVGASHQECTLRYHHHLWAVRTVPEPSASREWTRVNDGREDAPKCQY